MTSISEAEDCVNKDLQFRNSKFVIFQEIEWPSTGGVDTDALPTKPVSVPVSRIREMRPAKTWKTWAHTVEIRTSNNRIAVRGTLDEIVSKLNGPDTPDTPRPFAPTLPAGQGREKALRCLLHLQKQGTGPHLSFRRAQIRDRRPKLPHHPEELVPVYSLLLLHSR
jgi:hypothetical protein